MSTVDSYTQFGYIYSNSLHHIWWCWWLFHPHYQFQSLKYWFQVISQENETASTRTSVSAEGLQSNIMLGRLEGKRSRGRPRKRWLDDVKKWGRFTKPTYMENVGIKFHPRQVWEKKVTDQYLDPAITHRTTECAIQISLNRKSLVDAKIPRSRQVLTLAAQSKESVTKIEPLYAVDSTPFSTLKKVMYQYYSYVTSNYGISSTVVFDGYSDGPSVKDHEHNRRIMASGGYAHIQIEHHATVLSNQHGFLANDENKSKLIDQLTN
ncbi:hypothetical protein GQR58_028632 [Nymphon striatum]|nr:hypothetical protein GQR58_028632 [Nymphon striatum]